MGTTLTGTTPQDTYDSLIKVTDNGPLSATAKFLSDGLGNDSALALSTTAVGIGTAAPAAKLDIVGTAGNTQLNVTSGSGTFPFITLDQTGVVKYAIQNVATTGLFTITEAGVGDRLVIAKTSGNVGIGTSAPVEKLAVKAGNGNQLGLDNAGERFTQISFFNNATQKAAIWLDETDDDLVLYSSSGYETAIYANNAERVRVTANGLTFNGDTAAANALDDYEEGTWTMGVSFGGASVGVTTAANSGTYTKIGRKVTVNGYLVLTNKGSSTGIAFLTGLPFTVGNTSGNFGAASLWFNVISFTNQFQGRFNQNQNYIELEEITILGVTSNLTNADFANDSQIMISATYFV